MDSYRNILVAVDLTEDCDQIITRAMMLAAPESATMTLAHIIEFVPVEPMGEAILPSVQIEEELRRSASQRLNALGEKFGIPGGSLVLRTGNVKGELLQLAEKQQSDLIVLGSRGRHGLAVLINLTEDTILHAAPCDVLAVRLS